MSADSTTGTLFINDVAQDLSDLVAEAGKMNARRLLLLPDKFPVCRVGSELSPPLRMERLHFNQTLNLVHSILTPEQLVELDKAGELDTEITVGPRTYSVNIFFGNGSHNVVIYLAD